MYDKNVNFLEMSQNYGFLASFDLQKSHIFDSEARKRPSPERIS